MRSRHPVDRDVGRSRARRIEPITVRCARRRMRVDENLHVGAAHSQLAAFHGKKGMTHLRAAGIGNDETTVAETPSDLPEGPLFRLLLRNASDRLLAR